MEGPGRGRDKGRRQIGTSLKPQHGGKVVLSKVSGRVVRTRLNWGTKICGAPPVLFY